MSISAKIIARIKEAGAQGAGLYLLLTINRYPRRFFLNKHIDPSCWDEKEGKATSKYTNYKKLNDFLDQKLVEAKKIILNYELQEKLLSFELFKGEFVNISNVLSFYDFAENEIVEMEPKRKKESIRHCRSKIKKMKGYKPRLTFNDINYDFLSKYQNYLINDLGNDTNTIYSNFKFIRKLLKIAKIKRIIKENPFDGFELKTKPTSREYLTIAELIKLEELIDFQIPLYLKNALHSFLFGCYTGLRFSDVEVFNRDCVEGKNIKLKMVKTGEVVYIPLTDRIKRLVSETDSHKSFKSISNQKMNKYVKELMGLVGIIKNITFHCARHTFATICLTLGMPIEVVQKLLGHKNIRETQIYGKIVDTVKEREMQKWNNLPAMKSSKSKIKEKK